MNNPKNITGFILAGGKSTRMGTDKGLMIFNGKPMINWVIESLQNSVEELIIVSDNQAYNDYGYKIISDLIPGKGPVGGIYTALQFSKTELNFIVSCDMPFIKKEIVQFIIDSYNNAGICIPSSYGRIQPLAGIYKKSCAEIFLSAIQSDELKLQSLLKRINTSVIELDNFFAAELFQNMNTPDDIKKAMKL